ncbi:MAG: hypothetical protein JSV36_04845 [Anaerolineae bacterium]|nr:MAG: hypothetical protein JSV36_04845 [Anaerolineae bacterium]
MESVPNLSIALLAACCVIGFLGLGGLVGLVVLLLKLGIIGQYALKQEPQEIDGQYTLSQSREARYEGEPDAE